MKIEMTSSVSTRHSAVDSLAFTAACVVGIGDHCASSAGRLQPLACRSQEGRLKPIAERFPTFIDIGSLLKPASLSAAVSTLFNGDHRGSSLIQYPRG